MPRTEARQSSPQRRAARSTPENWREIGASLLGGLVVELIGAGAKLDFAEEPKRIPSTKKWLRKLSPTPFVPMVTVKAGGREIDACVGFTELFLDNGNDKNLTNCEIYRAKAKSPIVCGELAAIVGYIPGIEIKTDAKARRIDLRVK